MIPIFRIKKNDEEKYYIVAVVTGINMTIMYSNNSLMSGLLNMTISEFEAKLLSLGATKTVEDMSFFDEYKLAETALNELNNIYVANVTADKSQEYEYQDFANIVQQWQEKHIYVVHQLVIFERRLYLCVQEHESTSFIEDLQNGKWLLSSFVGAGATTTVKIGSVKTGDSLSIVNSGTEANVVLDFVIPTGKDGASAFEIAKQNGYTGSESDWVASLNNSTIKQYSSKYDFPNLGSASYFYIDARENMTYRWDSKLKKYYCIGNDYNNVTEINGGNA